MAEVCGTYEPSDDEKRVLEKYGHLFIKRRGFRIDSGSCANDPAAQRRLGPDPVSGSADHGTAAEGQSRAAGSSYSEDS